MTYSSEKASAKYVHAKSCVGLMITAAADDHHLNSVGGMSVKLVATKAGRNILLITPA